MKLRQILNEFQGELVGNNMVVVNNKRYSIDKLPPQAKKIVTSVIRYIGKKNMKSFTKYDLQNYDIVTKADGTIKVTDDKGKTWSFKQ